MDAMLTLRLSPELRAALEKRSASEERSLSATVRVILKRELERPQEPRQC